MHWLVWVALAGASILVARKLFLSPKDFGAATNALLTEQCLSGASLQARRHLASGVLEVLRAGGFPNVPEDRLVAQFNRRDRFVQLNLVALALDRAGLKPLLSGEVWHPIRNPLQLHRVENNILAVADRIRGQHSVSLTVGSKPLVITANGIEG